MPATLIPVLAGLLPRVKEWNLLAVLDVAGILGLVWAIALTVHWLSKRNLRLHVGPDGVCLEQGASRQLVPWAAITQVVVRSDARVEHGIDIYTAEGRELELENFERLPEIVNLIKAGVSPTVPVKED